MGIHTRLLRSFGVVDVNNHLRCFGCGERGEVIDLVRRTQGLPYPEALRFLGMTVLEAGNSLREEAF
jgi:DNA primase